MTLKNVLVVEDHTLFRAAFCKFLESIFDPPPTCDQAIHGYDALDKLKSKSYDVMFLDVNMPLLNGVGLFRILDSEHLTVPTIVVSQYLDWSLISFFLQHKSCGYLSKSASPSQIVEAVAAVLEGNQYLQSDVDFPYKGSYPKPALSFTAREFALLREISQGHSSKEIASNMGLTQRTIETYRERLLQKTGAKNSAELLAYAFRIGSGIENL